MDNDIGKFLRRKRKEKKLTLEAVAKSVGVGKGTVSKWERGAIKNMKTDKAKAVATILGFDPLILIHGIDNNENTDDISPKQLKQEVTRLLSITSKLTEKEKQMLLSTLNYICDEKD